MAASVSSASLARQAPAAAPWLFRQPPCVHSCARARFPCPGRRLQLRLNAVVRALEFCNSSAGALPTLRHRGGRLRMLTAVTAASDGGGGGGGGGEGNGSSEEEEEGLGFRDGGVGEEEGGQGLGMSGVRNAVVRGVGRFVQEFSRELKNETGMDSGVAKDRVVGMYEAARERSGEAIGVAKKEVQSKLADVKGRAESVVQAVRYIYWPQFVRWNRIELWQDRQQWDAQRVGAFFVYVLVVGSFLRGAHMIVTAPRVSKKDVADLTEAYLESVIPEPTPANVRKFKKAVWQETMPKGFSMKKYKLGKDGEYQRDFSFAEDNSEEEQNLKQEMADENARAASDGNQDASGETEIMQGEGASELSLAQNLTWQERLIKWEKILRKESIKENLEAYTSRYGVERDWAEAQAKIERAKQEELGPRTKMRAFWVARKWWKYRPNMPYTYFLDKVQNLEVRAAVYTVDMKRLFVTMKEGFPTDYVVDLPVDPDLYETLQTCGVEVDVLFKSDIFYYGRILLLLAPSLLIIWYIRELQYYAKERASEKVYDLLSMNRQHLILPEDAADKARTQYKDVVVGGDVWQVIDEIMIYMRNPMKYHDRRVKLPRGILISGPPGTGKTLLARAIARESGLPFVFASGAEFVESGTGTGTDKVFDIFFTARANAPSFVFIDEIDALAGKNSEDDAERRATFEQLLSELDAEPEDTDVDRFSARQAVILICATNRPDELDERFMRPGRIDREIYIGLPGEEERIGIFDVHSQGKRVGKDVDFSKLVFRTIGYSGADIRNLINEAGIMAVRKGHDEMSQQDLVEVLDKQLFEGMGVVLMDDEQKRVEQKIPSDSKRLLAVHEAGHVLLAHLFPSFDWHAFSHLLPGGSESALSVFYPRQEMLRLGHTTVGYVKMQMVVAHGGRCAEQLIYGDNISDGGQDDLARISGMARELTISPANSRLGLLPMKWRDTLDAPKLPGEVDLIPNEWEKPGTHIINMTVEMSELFTREVTKYVTETEEMAMTALSQNQHILEKLADVLFSKTKLSGLEAAEIIRSMDPVLLPDLLNSMSNIDFKASEEEAAPPNMRGRYEEMNIYPAPLHRC